MKKTRKSKPGLFYGLVPNSQQAWVKMRCPVNSEDAFLPGGEHNTANPIWSGSNEDEVTDEDYRFDDALSEKSNTSRHGETTLKTVQELKNERLQRSN